MLCVASFFMYGVNNVMISLAPLTVMDMGASAAAAGFQGTFFIVFAIVLRTVLMPLTSRIGTKRLMLLGAVSFAAASALFPFCTTYGAFLAARAVQAVGLAVFWPLSVSAVVDVSDAENTGSWLGISRFATAASMAVGPYAAFALCDVAGAGWVYGALFLASALAIVAVAACKLPDSARKGDGTAAKRAARRAEESRDGQAPLKPRYKTESAVSDAHADARSLVCGARVAGKGVAGEFACDEASKSSPRANGATARPAGDAEGCEAAGASAFAGGGEGGDLDLLAARRSRVCGALARGMWLAGVLVVSALGAATMGLVMHFSALVVGEVDGALNAASYLSLFSIGGMAASLLLGPAFDRGKWQAVLPACILAMGLGVMQLGMAQAELGPLVAGGLLAGFGNSGVSLACMDLIARKASPAARDAAMGYRQSAVDIGVAVAATAFGVAFDAAPTTQTVFLWWGAAMVCFAVATCAVCTRSARKRARR